MFNHAPPPRIVQCTIAALIPSQPLIFPAQPVCPGRRPGPARRGRAASARRTITRAAGNLLPSEL
eukprot:690127-Hanusia_phi.AAC.2